MVARCCVRGWVRIGVSRNHSTTNVKPFRTSSSQSKGILAFGFADATLVFSAIHFLLHLGGMKVIQCNSQGAASFCKAYLKPNLYCGWPCLNPVRITSSACTVAGLISTFLPSSTRSACTSVSDRAKRVTWHARRSQTALWPFAFRFQVCRQYRAEEPH